MKSNTSDQTLHAKSDQMHYFSNELIQDNFESIVKGDGA